MRFLLVDLLRATVHARVILYLLALWILREEFKLWR